MAESSPPADPMKSRLQLLILMLLPIAVVLLATLVFYTGIGMPEGTRNKGVLIAPPQSINELTLRDDAGSAVQFDASKDQMWTFLVVHAAACDENCRRQFWEIRQTHTALGKYQSHIQRVWLVTDGQLDDETRAWLKAEHSDMRLIYTDGGAWQSLLRRSPEGMSSETEARFFLVDPRGFVMMYYRWADTYKDVITDMKFLLKGVE